MATLSLTNPKPTPSFYNHHRSRRRVPLPSNTICCRHHVLLRPISAAPRIPSTPATAPPGELYQPFRLPPSPIPAKYRSLGPVERLDILRNRLGLWHEYAPLISSLPRDGFTPPSIEEITGITSIEQNRIAVASKVRDSLVSHSSFPPDLLPFFDADSGADLLYELRLLSVYQRVAAARHVVQRRLDAKAAQELARAIKDFPRRRGDAGWECFSAESPGDCLAYTDFRLSREAIAQGERAAALEKAMEAAETESARSRIAEEMDKRGNGGDGVGEEVLANNLPLVIRLRYGEVAEASSVVLLPVCRAAGGEEELETAPGWCRAEGEMGVVAAERAWERWVVLPGWLPAMAVGGKGGVAVEFGDGRVLPWRKGRWEKEEAVLALVDRDKKEVVVGEETGFYLVGGGKENNGLVVERGRKLLEKGKSAVLGAVVMVVRPPKDEDDEQLNDEDWE